MTSHGRRPGPGPEVRLPAADDAVPAAGRRPSGSARFDGVDVSAPRAQLVELARQLGVHVTTRMSKAEVAAALEGEIRRRSRPPGS